jgi:hypothetical protein
MLDKFCDNILLYLQFEADLLRGSNTPAAIIANHIESVIQSNSVCSECGRGCLAGEKRLKLVG